MSNTEDKRLPFESTMKDIKDAIGDVARAIGQGGGSGGHTIQNSAGTDLPQEDKLQFVDAHLSDDSTNGKTIVENIKEVTLSELEQATERGMYLATDEDSVPIGEIEEDVVSVTADGVKTLTQLFVELINECDTSKLNGNSYIKQSNGNLLYYQYPICFSQGRTSNTDSSMLSFIYQGSSNTAICFYSLIAPSGTTINNGDSTPTNGEKLTLHYGTSSGIVELNTDISYSTAERKIGKWIDGSDLYEKTVSCGVLPNNAEKTVAHNISNLKYIVDIKGIAIRETNPMAYPMPFLSLDNLSYGISLRIGTINIAITTKTDFSYMDKSYVTLRYTKV